MEVPHECLVVFFCLLIIPNAVLLPPQVYAPETVLARTAKGEERTLGAILGVVAALEPITVNTVCAVVTQLRLHRHRALDAILGIPRVVAVQAILGVRGIEDEIAIPVVREIVAVITILVIECCESRLRHARAEGTELFEERRIPSNLFRKHRRIPLVAVPVLIAHDGKQRGLREHRKNLLPIGKPRTEEN